MERNNSKIHEPQAKVELSGLKKREYMTFSRLISTACDLQGSCWSIHFEYIYFSLYRAKIMCSRHENTKSTFTLLRTACGGGLPNYCCIYSCCCFYLFCFVLFCSLFWYDNFVFIYLCIFFFCSDINECVRRLHKCSSGAFCNNTKGSYNCTCKHGFTGNGRECKGSC